MGSRFPYLHQRGDVFYFFWEDAQRKRREESLRTKDIEIAKRRYFARMKELEEGRLPSEMRDWPLAMAVMHWLEHRKLRVSRGTFKAERSIGRNLCKVLRSNPPLHSLADIGRIRHYQDQRLSAGTSAKTVNNEINVLAGILRLADLWHRVEPQYERLRVMKSDLADALTLEESTRLLTVAAGAHPGAVAPYAAVLAFSTGMRSGEIKGLRLGDLHQNEEHAFLYVRRATTKTNSGARRVVLDRMAVWSVEKLITRAQVLGCTLPEHYLLPTDCARHTRSNDPLHGRPAGFDPAHPQSSWEAEWQKFRLAVGIPHRRFHDLRHSYVTRAGRSRRAHGGCSGASRTPECGNGSTLHARLRTGSIQSRTAN